jgi:HK97 family phage major capsid protein
MSKKLRELKAKKAALVAQGNTLTAAAADGVFSEAQQAEFDGLKAQIEGLNRQIEAEEFLIKEGAGMAAGQAAPYIEVSDRRSEDPTLGFRSFGEYAAAVRNANPMVGRGAVDERLLIGAAAPSTFGNESNGPDGGFSIPPAYATDIWTHALEEDSLLPFTDNTEISGNGLVLPKDETTPWGTDGIRSYWQGEALAGTPTKPKLSALQMRLHKLLTLVPITDELLADSTALGSYLTKKLPISIRWKTDEAILWGTGNGTPVGALKGNAVVTVAKDSGQATNTLTALNLANMIARLPAGSYGKAIWMINNDVLPALFTLTLGNYPIYMPGGAPNVGGIQLNPYGMLLGRPVVVSQHAKSFSSQGDVSLLDLSYYRTITKAEGIQTATSLHLYFDADAAAFRATFRIDGQPGIVNPIAPANGSNNLSPFVQLGAR